MVLELPVASSASIIITFNIRDFAGADQFEIHPMTPQEFLKKIEGDRT